MKYYYCLTILLLMSLCSSLEGQTIDVNTRFGKVSKDEVQLNHYDRDTSAKALMLFENTQIYLGINAAGQFFVSRKKHLRIKVLKEDGVKWPTMLPPVCLPLTRLSRLP